MKKFCLLSQLSSQVQVHPEGFATFLEDFCPEILNPLDQDELDCWIQNITNYLTGNYEYTEESGYTGGDEDEQEEVTSYLDLQSKIRSMKKILLDQGFDGFFDDQYKTEEVFFKGGVLRRA